MRRMVVLALAAALAGCSWHSGLPVYGSVPEFKLKDAQGRDFPSGELAGQVWVADFFFTTCNGPCPRMAAQLRKVQEAYLNADNVKIISITIDPARDTPEALAAYAKRWAADGRLWWFLTGQPADIRRISYDAFHLSDVGGSLDHSTKFGLVDRRMRIRGYYDSLDANGVDDLIADIEKLRKEVF